MVLIDKFKFCKSPSSKLLMRGEGEGEGVQNRVLYVLGRGVRF